jgi:D-lactate dehydrogenase
MLRPRQEGDVAAILAAARGHGDYDDPIDILQNLMIGSEGTLGFIARITHHSVADPHFKAAALALFPDIRAVCEATIALKTQPVDAVELMDRLSLRAVGKQPGMPGNLAAPPENAAALLIETRAADAETLAARVAAVTATLVGARMIEPAAFTEDPKTIKQYRAVGKGAFPSVGAMRATGAAVIIEDVAVPIERLADATLELRALFARHGYDDAIVFGHPTHQVAGLGHQK